MRKTDATPAFPATPLERNSLGVLLSQEETVVLSVADEGRETAFSGGLTGELRGIGSSPILPI